jgi:hypothetical protein
VDEYHKMGISMSHTKCGGGVSRVLCLGVQIFWVASIKMWLTFRRHRILKPSELFLVSHPPSHYRFIDHRILPVIVVGEVYNVAHHGQS